MSSTFEKWGPHFFARDLGHPSAALYGRWVNGQLRVEREVVWSVPDKALNPVRLPNSKRLLVEED